MSAPKTPCPKCYDAQNDRITGVTRETAPVMREIDDRLVTVKRGSGCPACLGKGIIE